jgi:hypothetical protein
VPTINLCVVEIQGARYKTCLIRLRALRCVLQKEALQKELSNRRLIPVLRTGTVM